VSAIKSAADFLAISAAVSAYNQLLQADAVICGCGSRRTQIPHCWIRDRRNGNLYGPFFSGEGGGEVIRTTTSYSAETLKHLREQLDRLEIPDLMPEYEKEFRDGSMPLSEFCKCGQLK
jgi:hypothetical protein